jgi:hypothetical protein
LLSKHLFITYADVTSATASPLSILQQALKLEGYSVHFTSVADAYNFISTQLKKKILIVIDEAQKYYTGYSQSSMEQAKKRVKIESETMPMDDQKWRSHKCINEVYALSVNEGVTCILCGSSSKLVELGIQHSSTPIAQALLEHYPDSPNLNSQKFLPLVLNNVTLSQLKDYLQVFCIVCTTNVFSSS